MFSFNDLLTINGISPQDVAVALHKPANTSERQALCTMIDEDFAAFNAYQSTHARIPEATLKARGIMASFVMTSDGRMTFVGLFANAGSQPFAQAGPHVYALFVRMTRKMTGPDEVNGRSGLEALQNRLLFDLSRLDTMSDLSGRLIVQDPGARNYMRVADRTPLPVVELTKEAQMTPPVPNWDALVLTAPDLRKLPNSWRVQLSAWRGVYLIVDRCDGARYVGAAYGSENLFGRWSQHVAREIGITKELSQRDPAEFQFSILELLSPAATADEVIGAERKWMRRIGTLEFGLNT